MKKNLYPYYEEFFSMMKAAGKRIFFIVDGCADVFADDLIACGADGIITEPFTDFKAIARKHKDVVLAGEGDNRILMRNNRDEIYAMTERMVETAGITGGYLMSIGNHIPYNVPPEAIQAYLEISDKIAYRKYGM